MAWLVGDPRLHSFCLIVGWSSHVTDGNFPSRHRQKVLVSSHSCCGSGLPWSTRTSRCIHLDDNTHMLHLQHCSLLERNVSCHQADPWSLLDPHIGTSQQRRLEIHGHRGTGGDERRFPGEGTGQPEQWWVLSPFGTVGWRGRLSGLWVISGYWVVRSFEMLMDGYFDE